MEDKPVEWADATRSLLDAPEGERIERHANDLLNRALNGRPVVAFVGAGTSMAYGRISWRDAVTQMQDTYLSEKESKLRSVSAKQAYKLLRRQKIDPNGDSSGNDYLVAFQLAEQFSHVLARDQSKDGQTTGATFRDTIKAMLLDDYGHAQLMLRRGMALPEIELKIVDKPDQHRKDIRSSGYARTLLENIAESGLAAKFRLEIRAFLRDKDDRYVQPYHRFIIEVLLKMIDPRIDATNGGKAEFPVPAPFWLKKRVPRPELLPLSRDPLRLLYGLGITRFLTTNYDEEVQKLFQDEGLVPEDSTGPLPDTPEHDPLARTWRELDFDREQVGNLLAFAARDGRRIAEVAHLHGKATPKGRITVTTSDYQQRYLSADDRRSGMDDALSAAFGGNPILFVGSGMGEDDLLRPLRQFVGDRSPNPGRLAIALVPADKEQPRIEAEKIQNLQRYGVYTIHYGRTPGDNVWLYRVKEAGRKIKKILATVQVAADGTDSARKNLAGEARKLALEHRELWQQPAKMEDMPIEDHPEIAINKELKFLETISNSLESIVKARDLSERKRIADALAIGVTGCLDSITGAFLCAKLIQLRSESARWLKAWQELPIAENPVDKLWPSTGYGSGLKGAQYVRHGVDLADFNDKTADPRDRFYTGAPSQTFYHLLASLYANRELLGRPRGRRLFLLVGERGVGKGHFFAALSGNARLSEFRRAIGDAREGWPAAFFNTSFSHEITSVFDLVIEFLHRSLVGILKAENETAIRDIYLDAWTKENRLGRIERLRFILQALADHRFRLRGRRIILGFNGFSMFFDAEGKSKNAQLRRLFNVLLGDGLEAAPLDIILLAGDRWIPAAFRKPGDKEGAKIGEKFDIEVPGSAGCFELRRPELKRSTQLRLERISRRVHQVTEPANPHFQAFVHYLNPARASIVLMSFFPSIALAIGLRSFFSRRNFKPCAEKPSQYNLKHVPPIIFSPTTATEIRGEARALLTPPSDDPSKYGTWADGAKLSFPRIIEVAALDSAYGKNWIEKRLKENGAIDVREKLNRRPLQRLAKSIDEEFKQLFEACGRSRYTLTVLLASAYQHLVPVAEAAAEVVKRTELLAKAREKDANYNPRNAIEAKIAPGETIHDAAVALEVAEKDPALSDVPAMINSCNRFIDRMVLRLTRLPEVRRRTLVIETALGQIREFDVASTDHLPGERSKLTLLPAGLELVRLQNVLLWQLSVIGQPVISKILARAPLVVDACRALHRVSGRPEIFEIKLAEDMVDQALAVFQRRCLIFRLRSKAPGEPPNQPRFAVHRQIQTYIFRHMHAPSVEYAETNQFAITLFTSQTHAVPRLSQTSHADLHRSVAAMIDYPESVDRDDPIASWSSLPIDCPGRHANLRLRAKMLRAALGMVRAVYSLSTLAKLTPISPSELSDGTAGLTFQRGLLEEHRLLIRWMLHQAVAIDQAWGNDTSALRPFYQEEIVWLYNECAVMSHMQGRIPHALSLFERAEEAARQNIEVFREGALRTRIALNRALTDIDRGRLLLAGRALGEILKIDDEHPVILLIACGLSGLVQHLRGRHLDAEQHYARALGIPPIHPDKDNPLLNVPSPGLIGKNRTRAASIITRHYADLLCEQRDYPHAERLADQSITLAIEGGHEDVRHLAQLSKIRITLDSTETADFQSTHIALNVVESYAEAMGMPRLQCEVDLTRTHLYERGGDLHAAARVGARGLTVATANDLRLRKATFLHRLAAIYHKLGRVKECRPLLQEAFEIARDTDYHTARAAGQKLWADIVGKDGESLTGP